MSASLPAGVISGTPDCAVIRLHLQPRASKTELCGIQGDELKVRVTSPPVDDAANRLCTDFFAKLFKTAKSNVTIVSGQKSRHKRLQIAGTSPQEAAALLATRL